MPKTLVVLIFPLDGYGHINCCHGIAEVLRNRGHRIIFALDIAFKGKLVNYGFEEEIYGLVMDNENANNENKEFWPEFVRKHSDGIRSSSIVAFEKFRRFAFMQMFLKNKALDSKYAEIIARVKPDIILIDMYIGCPSLTNCNIPWVWINSCAPHIMFNSESIPPFGSGLSINSGKKEWLQFTKRRDAAFSELYNCVKHYYESKRLSFTSTNKLHPISPYLNLYMYPKELEYEELKPISRHFFGFDASVRITTERFIIPKILLSKPGKLVYLSMGSFASADLQLMARLINVLSKSRNKFIVSKGALHNSYELPDNMWGQKMLPQTKVLPLVDLVIHHGGNNTLTETFYFGKPMIIMPLFGDQYDNAQRVAELGYGLRLSPYHCSEKQLLDAVNILLADNMLAEKMCSIGKRIRNSNSLEKAAELIERIAKESSLKNQNLRK